MKSFLVIGVGCGGNNAVDCMIEADMKDVAFIAINGDDYSLKKSHAGKKISISLELKGLGQIMPEGYAIEAEKKQHEISKAIEGTDIVCIVSCMGGEVGTGASPVIAKLATELGVKTISLVTMPFRFEGVRRKKRAEEGLIKLKAFSDELYVVELDELISEKTQIEIFNLSDDTIAPISVTLNKKTGLSLDEAFSSANEAICESIYRLISLSEQN